MKHQTKKCLYAAESVKKIKIPQSIDNFFVKRSVFLCERKLSFLRTGKVGAADERNLLAGFFRGSA